MSTFWQVMQLILMAIGMWTVFERAYYRGLIGMFLPDKWWARPWTDKTTEAPTPEGETYGLKFAPVPRLHAMLPPPPSGHMWEIFTDGQGDDLRLVCRLSTFAGAVVAERRGLVHEIPGGQLTALMEEDAQMYWIIQTAVAWACEVAARVQRGLGPADGEYMVKS